MRRLLVAGLVSLAIIPVAAVADQMSSLGQFFSISAVAIAVTLALPHYFYRGEPLLPDRRKRR